MQRGKKSTLVEPGYPGCSCDFCQGPLMFLCFSVFIDARSSMPNPSGKIWRCNVPPEGCTLHRIFQSSMPNHRCPIIEPQSIEKKTMDVQFATGGAANCTDFSNHRCPIIDAQSIGKIWRCNLQPEGCKLHRLFPSSMPNFSGTPIKYQRTPLK